VTCPCRFRAVNAELDRISRDSCHLPRSKLLRLRSCAFDSHSLPPSPNQGLTFNENPADVLAKSLASPL